MSSILKFRPTPTDSTVSGHKILTASLLLTSSTLHPQSPNLHLANLVLQLTQSGNSAIIAHFPAPTSSTIVTVPTTKILFQSGRRELLGMTVGRVGTGTTHGSVGSVVHRPVSDPFFPQLSLSTAMKSRVQSDTGLKQGVLGGISRQSDLFGKSKQSHSSSKSLSDDSAWNQTALPVTLSRYGDLAGCR